MRKLAKPKKLSVAAQKAAVTAVRSEGKSLDEIEKDHPELKDGVAAVREESTASPEPKGSGSTRAFSSMTRRPTL